MTMQSQGREILHMNHWFRMKKTPQGGTFCCGLDSNGRLVIKMPGSIEFMRSSDPVCEADFWKAFADSDPAESLIDLLQTKSPAERISVFSVSLKYKNDRFKQALQLGRSLKEGRIGALCF